MWPFSASYPEYTARQAHQASAEYDYVVIGGGTSGCCLASRLSEDPSKTVLLIERGGVGDTWVSRVPLLSADIFRDGSPSKMFPLQPSAALNNRVLKATIGNGLGGASRVNGCVYTRGPLEFDLWAKMGHPSWGYKSLEPFFVKSENALSHPESTFHGKQGSWINQIFSYIPFKAVNLALEAAQRLGIPFVEDVNSPESPVSACGFVDLAIDLNQHRMSTLEAFLPTFIARSRPNLVVCTNTTVSRITFVTEKGSKPRVDSVVFEDSLAGTNQVGRSFSVKVKKEAILCAGPFSNPQILMLSGVGPKEHLDSLSINVVKDLPGVGSYLKDHAALGLMFRVPERESLHVLRRKPWLAILPFFQYITTGKGLFCVPFMQQIIYTHSSLFDDNFHINLSAPDNLPDVPDIEVMSIPHRCEPVDQRDSELGKQDIFSFLTALLKPKSYGSVRLASTDPQVLPVIDLGFLSNPADMVVLRKQIGLVMKLAEEIRSQGYPLDPHHVPTDDNDKTLDAFIRDTLRTTYHYSSTCRMAAEDDPESPGVVDDELRVWGIDGLRICDTSVFPDMISTHPMAPAVVFAERCASMIKETSESHGA